MHEIPDAVFTDNSDSYSMWLHGIKTGQTPLKLYKYMTKGGFERFLSNGKLLFAKRDMLNDPFECAACVDTQNSYEEWCNFLRSNQVNPFEVPKFARMMTTNKVYAKESIMSAINVRENLDGFLCLTASCDNLLMWAHYANDHKGVCLEFDVTKDLDTFYFPKKVEYKPELISYNYLRDQAKAAETLFRKSPDWEYEQEYRVLKINGYGLREIKRAALTSVVFGCRMKEEDRLELTETLHKKGYHPLLKEAKQSETEYKLIIQEIAH